MYNEQAERHVGRMPQVGARSVVLPPLDAGPDRRGLASGTFGRALIRALRGLAG